jgi:hypothetical protein
MTFLRFEQEEGDEIGELGQSETRVGWPERDHHFRVSLITLKVSSWTSTIVRVC